MLNPDDWKIAIEDARHRHSAVVSLIYFTDSQAMHLLRLYLTVAIAAAAGAASSFTPQSTLPLAGGYALAGAATALTIGALFCFKAMAPTTVNLPGRGAEFWLWANDPDVTRDSVFTKYLEGLGEKTTLNNKVNDKSAKALKTAKRLGIAAPIIALLVALAAYFVA